MPTAEAIKKAFDHFDTDGSGKLSSAEIAAALAKGGKKTLTPEDIESIVAKVDTNKDGEVSLEEFEAIFKLAPDAMPHGLRELVSASGTVMTGLGMVADALTMPVNAAVGMILPTATADVFNSGYVYDKPTEYVLREKFFSFGASTIKDAAGTDILKVPIKAATAIIKTQMRICDMQDKELLLLEELVMSYSPTFYVKTPSGATLLTLRAKMLTLENYIHVYEGKAEFGWANDTNAKKLFVLKGFSILKGSLGLGEKTGLFGASVEDAVAGKVCARTKETVIAIRDTYTLVVDPGYDCLLFLAMMLCVDKINERRDWV